MSTSLSKSMRTPVNTKKPPKMYMTQWKRVINAAPKAMSVARMTSAPRTPQSKTLGCTRGSTLK